MHAGPKTEYHWIDDKGKKVKGLSAPQYFDYLETYINNLLDDEREFPCKANNKFPSDFNAKCRKIYRLLFTCLAHFYHEHYSDLKRLGQVSLSVYLYIYIYMCVCIACMYVYVLSCMYVCIIMYCHICMYVCVCVCIIIYVCMGVYVNE